MAEFQEVMRQLGRICSTNFGECDICDLRPFCPAKTFIDKYAKSVRAARLEEMVLSWAAEHPEPVYPTWGEWLVEIGAAKRVPIGDPWPVEMADGSMIGPEYETVLAQNERIPADIAQKLGIEPKEGI